MPRTAEQEKELAEMDEWIRSLKTPESFAEDAYEAARLSHGDALPKFLRTPWSAIPTAYREFLTFVAQYAIDSASAQKKSL